MNTKRPRYHENDGRFYNTQSSNINTPIFETPNSLGNVVNSVPALPKGQIAQNRNLQIKDSREDIDLPPFTEPILPHSSRDTSPLDDRTPNFKTSQNKNDWISTNQNHPNSPNNRMTDQHEKPRPTSIFDGFRNFLTGMGKAVNQVLG